MILSTNKKTVILILIAFTFSFAVRLIWVQNFFDTQQFKFNGEFMINTNDGYYYAEGARDILANKTENTNDLSPFTSAASKLTAFIAKVLPFSFETIIFYMPAFFSSLLVIPLILIGRTFGKLEVGFVAALIGSIAWSYYNRTMVGYYDTDFLNIVLPAILLWSLIWAIDTKKNVYLFITALDILVYRWWYPQSVALEFAFVGLIALFALYQYFTLKKDKIEDRKQAFVYSLKLISIMLIAMMMVNGYIRAILVIAIFFLFANKKYDKYIYYILIASLIAFLSTGGLQLIWGKLEGYVFAQSVKSSTDGLGLHFFTVMQTIREANTIPFETFANRISGHTITFIASIIGYLYLIIRFPIMLLALPMLGLGFLALSGGLRFTIYAVPIMALGLGFLVYEISNYIAKNFIKENAQDVVKYSLLSFITVFALYPNIKHVQEYKVPTVFNNNEVQVLHKLKDIVSQEDYVVAWWDYGYPLRYYSDVKTLVDGGKHSGAQNYPVSFILTSPQEQAAKLARLDVEYTEKRFHLDNTTKWASSNIEQMTLDYGYKDTNDFIESLSLNITLPKKTRDIYLYLPNRMMSILPTITLFSNIDLMSGKKGNKPFFYKSNSINNTDKTIELGNTISIIKDSGQVKIGKQTFPINNFIVSQYNSKGQLEKTKKTVDKTSPINIIYMKDYKQFLVLDAKMYNSTYIQLFVLENYDKNLYEPIILNPYSKVYKLKI